MNDSTASPGKSGFVALLGWTNVGKSTLLNRLLGEKVAATADVPQTTRHRITGVLTLPGRGQVAFVDTPGLHAPRHRMNRAMVDRARQSVSGVDVVVVVLDAARGLGSGDAQAARLALASGGSCVAALNKIDLLSSKAALLPLMKTVVEDWSLPDAIPICALDGDGCDVLVDRILDLLPEGPWLFPADYLTDQTERALAAEWIRERLLRHTRQEIPHATAVTVDRWTSREDGIIEIEASVLVERDSQKAIVIGKGGQLLKRVGTEARAELERLLGARVFLRLWVRVRRDWRDDARLLHEIGLGD